MPNFTDLNAAVSAGDADLLALVQGGETKKITAAILSRLNWLGAVSQSMGVPTGAIIERGSNANGEYAKFADGTLICSHVIAGYDGGTSGNQWTFPAAFAVTPDSKVELGLSGGNYGSASVLIATGATDSTKFTIFKYGDTLGTNTGASNFLNYNLHFCAFGRWF